MSWRRRSKRRGPSMWTERRWLLPLLTVSLLANLFLVGLVGGHMYARHKIPPRREGPVVTAAHLRALPADERKMFTAVMAAQRPAIAEARRLHLEARRVLEADIAAAAFDKDKVTADFAAFRRAGQALQEKSNAALVDALATLSPASRASLMSKVQSPQDDRGGRR